VQLTLASRFGSTSSRYVRIAMQSFVRRSLLALVLFAGLVSGSVIVPADAAAGPRSAGSKCCILQKADVLLHAGRVVVVRTTVAFARALKHEALAHRSAAGSAQPGGR